MAYKVQFVGLTGFVRESGRVRALLPDGRFTSPEITPHYASITVRRGDFVGNSSNWQPNEIVSSPDQIDFFFIRPSFILFPAATDQPLDASALGRGLRHLINVDPRFQLSAQPNWIACTNIEHGTLRPLRWPATPDDGTPAYLTQWDVPFAGTTVTIQVTPRKGWPTKTITLNDGGDLAITVLNSSRGGAAGAGDHFQIYEELSSTEVVLPSEHNVVGVAESTIALPLFSAPAFALNLTGCSGAIVDPNGP